MHSNKVVLIVTQEFDPHADAVLVLLEQQGYRPIRLHLANMATKSSLHFAVGSQIDLTGQITIDGKCIDISSIRSVWWRKPNAFVFSSELNADEKAFVRMEFNQLTNGLWSALDCYWMSDPANIRRASYKIEQLKRASKFGLEIPKTLFTNDPLQVKRFYEDCNGQIIYKVMSDPLLGLSDKEPVQHESTDLTVINNNKFVTTYTTPITSEHFQLLDGVTTAPCQFQEYVPKRVELRVTIIGDNMFVAEIHSQSHDRTKYDWRHFDVSIPILKGSLPVEIAEKCHKLMKSYGLNFSSMDFIVTPDERYVWV